MGPNCFQRLSADDNSRKERVKYGQLHEKVFLLKTGTDLHKMI